MSLHPSLSGPVRILAAPVVLGLLAAELAGEPPRSQSGGSFVGTYAYDSELGYDYGQFDDNGRRPAHYLNNRGREPRMPGKRSDPGDVDFFDPYYRTYLYNDGKLGDYDGLWGGFMTHGNVGREGYWRKQAHIPLRYDDFSAYQRFRYELGRQ